MAVPIYSEFGRGITGRLSTSAIPRADTENLHLLTHFVAALVADLVAVCLTLEVLLNIDLLASDLDLLVEPIHQKACFFLRHF